MRFPRSLALFALVLLLVGVPGPVVGGSPALPSPAGPVTDLVGVLGHGDRERLEAIVGQVRRQSGAEFAVLVVPSTAPESIEEYSIAIFDRWGIGQRGQDNGLLLLVAVQDRRMRITTGYGLEPVLPDGKVGEIRDREIVPFFRAGRYAEGILRGTEALAGAVLAAASGARSPAAPRPVARGSGSRKTGALLAVFVILILFATALSAADRRAPPGGRRRVPGRRSAWLPWGVGGGFGGAYGGWAAGRRGGWSGGFGGGFGGGGFGGFGGGSSGGGGAGGSW